MLIQILSPRWRKVIRDLWDNKARTTLVVISIAVGVFAFGSVFITRDVLLEDLNAAYRERNPASVVFSVTAFPETLENAVSGMREVADAEARRLFSTKAEIAPGRLENIDLYVLPDYNDMRVNTLQLNEGRWPRRREMLVERGSLTMLNVEVGDTVIVELPDGTQKELIVSGIVHDMEVFPTVVFPLMNGYITPETLEWLGEDLTYSTLLVTVAENRDDQDAADITADQIASRIELEGFDVTDVAVREPYVHPASDFLTTLTTVLAGIGVFALALSGGLVLNTITAILAQQRRQIGMMKSVGAQRPQVIAIYMAMVAVFGLLSLFVAVPIGMLIALGLTSVIAQFLNIDILNFRLPLWVFGLQVLTGLIVPFFAALFPILGGTAVTVREAVSDYGIGRVDRRTPVDRALDSLIEGLQVLPRPVILSLRNTFRRKGRLSMTLLVLTLAGAIFIAVLSVRGSMLIEFDKIFNLFNYDVQMVLNGSYPIGQIEREAMRVEGVVSAESWTAASITRIRPDGTESNTFFMLAPPAESIHIQPTVVEGRWIQPGDQNDIVLTRDITKEEPDIQVGDTILLEVDGQNREWTVVGIIDTTGQQFAYTTFEYLSKLQGTTGRGTFVVFGTAQHDAAYQSRVAADLEDRFQRSGLEVGQSITLGQILGAVIGQIDFVIGFMLFMAALLAVVGGLGLAGTMSLNVLERTREIGVLRAVGASNWAVWRIVLVEGLVIGGISIVMAALLAYPLSRVFSVVVGNAFFERPLEPNYSVPGVFIWMAVALVIATVATLAPAMRASAVSVQESLAYE